MNNEVKRQLLDAAIKNVAYADGVLWQVKDQVLPAGAPETMICWALAQQRIEWISGPKGEDYRPQLPMFKRLAAGLEHALCNRLLSETERVLEHPCDYRPKEYQLLPLYDRALHFYAEKFDRNGYSNYKQILQKQNFSELSSS